MVRKNLRMDIESETELVRKSGLLSFNLCLGSYLCCIMAEPIIILPATQRYLPRLLACLGMAGLCLVAVFSVQNVQYGIFRTGALAMGVLGIPAFMLLGFYFFRMVVNKPPLVIADDENLKLQSGFMYSATAPWSEISELGLVQVLGKKYILFKLKNPDAVMEHSSGMELRSQRAYMKRFGTPMVLDTAVLDRDPMKFIEDIREKWG